MLFYQMAVFFMNNNMKKNIIYAGILFILPVLALAAPLEGVKGLLISFGGFIDILIRLVFGLSLVYFFWGVSQFILKAGEPKLREEGKNKMIWGIVALFVIVSIYGILNFIGQALDIDSGGTITNGIIGG